MACFHTTGICALFTDKLKISVRKVKAREPRCFKCKVVRLSGPTAMEFFDSLMAFSIFATKKGEKALSSLCFDLMVRMTFLDLRLLL
jgi:hypothetical protein